MKEGVPKRITTGLSTDSREMEIPHVTAKISQLLMGSSHVCSCHTQHVKVQEELLMAFGSKSLAANLGNVLHMLLD